MAVTVARLAEITRVRTDLASVRAAIYEILQTGQIVSADGRRLDHANLAELRKMENGLKAELAALVGTTRIRYVRPVV